MTSASFLDNAEARFERLLSKDERRKLGITFTPQWIVNMMVDAIASDQGGETTVIDVGAGVGRFALATAHALPSARVSAIEHNPQLAADLARQVAAARLVSRVQVINGDFLRCTLPRGRGRVIFLGNPPYVRHHSISTEDKYWLRSFGERIGKPLSGLSGLHVYFLLRCLYEAKHGDRILMILPTEWLETRYGTFVKAAILERCSSVAFYFFPASVPVFNQTMTTSVIVDLTIGLESRNVSAALICDGKLPAEVITLDLPRGFESQANWVRAAKDATGKDTGESELLSDGIELGDLFEIHRGQVTGMNAVWIANSETAALVPDQFLVPVVTDAREILDIPNGTLASDQLLRRAIDLPSDLSGLTTREYDRVAKFLNLAESLGASRTYIARHRTPWWRVGLKAPPAIIMSYMARRAPRFAVNACDARLLNIAHGLYPKSPLTQTQLTQIVAWLNSSRQTRVGRTYSGGLLKIEPREACKIRLPQLKELAYAKAA